MGKVHSYIKEQIELHRRNGQHDLLEYIATSAGMFWVEDGLEPWEREVHWPELELLSAFQFLRPALPPEQTAILDRWIAKYAGWRDQGIFFERYREAKGGKFSWEQERLFAEEELGRLIPRSHWWFWPPQEGE